MALYYLLKKNTVKFVLWAALSIAFKPFFIFSYIALILLKEKKIESLLDVGCGYGVLGITLKYFDKCDYVDMVDITKI